MRFPGKRTLVEPLTPIELAQRTIHGLAGTALPFASEIQAAFGKHDISNIRAHTGDFARRAAATLGARAFAYGNDVAFADTPDLHTAAHEAAHVVQQRQGVALKGGIDTPGDEYEQHADEVADAVVRGRSAEHLLDRLAGAGRSAGAAMPAVQRDTSKGTKPRAAVDPADLPPPPVGAYLVEITADGVYRFWFNTSEVNAWSSPLFTAMRFYMRQLFPGVGDAVIREAMLANKATFTDHNDPPGKFPANVRFELRVQPGLHTAVKAWMREHHPELPAHEIKLGTGNTRDVGGASGTAASRKAGGSRGGQASIDPSTSEDVARARALYERLYALFPESEAWRSGSASYPALLAYLAEHPELLAKLPHGKRGAQAASVDQLRALLAGFEQRRAEDGSSDGSRKGHHDGRAGGAEHGTRDGIKDNAESGPGGSRYGEKDGSKYGWAKWEPKGHIVVRPQLARYVAGSSVHAEVVWDTSVHPDAGLIVLPHHCAYSWTSTQGKKTVDSDGNSIFADDRYTSLELGKQKGQTTIEVVARSHHFKDKKRFRSEVVLEVVPEDELQQQVFDQAHVGADKTFQRDVAGRLQLNADQKALTVEDEIRSVDVTRGGVDALAHQGRLLEADRETLEEQSTKQRAALVEIQDKVQGGTPYIVRGTFLSREDSSSFELKLLMHVQRQQADQRNAYFELVLHDLTMGEPTQHPGAAHHTLIGERPDTVYRMLEDEALDAMAEHFHAHNDYPKGKIHLAAQRVAGQGVWERTRDTNNLRKKAKKVLGTVAMVGGAALFIVPGGGALATGIMVVSGAAGAASVALEIEDRMAKEGRLKFDRRLVVDVLQLASTALAFGALSNVLREMTVVGKSRYMLAMVSVDAAQGFVMAAETRDALRRIDADTALKLAGAHTDEERRQIRADRDRQVAEVIGGAIVSGGFLLVSVGGGMKQLVATTRAGKQFTVREPVKALADGSFTDLEAAIANQRFTHENRAVILTEAEAEFLEATLMQRRAVEAGKAPSERTTQKMAAQDPEAGKPPSERTTQKIPAQDPEAGKAPSERTTQRMPAQDPVKAPAHEPTQVTFQGHGDTIATAAGKVTPESGYFDLAVHGDANTFYVVHNGSWVAVKPNSVRKWLLKQPGYRGQKIRLISCEAGAAGDGVAQAMANGLGVEVKAPTETLWVHEDGRITIGADPHKPSTGAWREFSPSNARSSSSSVEPGPGTSTPRDQSSGPEVASSDAQAGPTSFGPKRKARPEPSSVELPPRKSNGQFVDPALEAKYQAYRARKKTAGKRARGRLDWKERVEWWQNESPVARGNRFDASVRDRDLYRYHQVNLEDGTRLDSYIHDGRAQRISRKATDFLVISDADFRAYVRELNTKYKIGKKIRSNAYPQLDGKALRGDAILEVPLANLDPSDPRIINDPKALRELALRRSRFEQIAADAGVELRYTAEE